MLNTGSGLKSIAPLLYSLVGEGGDCEKRGGVGRGSGVGGGGSKVGFVEK